MHPVLALMILASLALTASASGAAEPKAEPANVDCEVSEWMRFRTYTDYYRTMAPHAHRVPLMPKQAFQQDCSATCGGGFHIKFRTVLVEASGEGKPCPKLFEKQHCNTQACPQEEKKEVEHEPVHRRTIYISNEEGGHDSSSSSEAKRDCQVSSWITFNSYTEYYNKMNPCSSYESLFSKSIFSTTCSKTCGGGYVMRFRYITQFPAYRGASCPKLSEKQSCNTQACPVPVNCQVSSWVNVGSCTKTCGGGVQSRTRSVTVKPYNGGTACPALYDTDPCNTQYCPSKIDCKVSEWANAGYCTKTCGGGVQSRTRSVTTKPAYGGKSCPELYATSSCNSSGCPVDCVVSEWAALYGATCSKTCGGGVLSRSRTATVYASNNGKPCPSLYETVSCNTKACSSKVDCQVSQWANVYGSACSKTCGTGVQSRTRSVTVQPANYGNACPSLYDTVSCNTQACPASCDCQVSQWANIGSCSKTCGGGVQYRVRSVSAQPAYGGKSCPVLTDTTSCNTQACPIDCVVSEWTLFDTFEAYHAELHRHVHPDMPCGDVPYSGQCTKTCGGGYRTAYRIIQVAAANGGKACPDIEKQVSCNSQACSVDCQVSQWTNVYGSTCSKTCGNGVQSRTRTVIVQPNNGGAACPSLYDTISCNTQACPGDCVVSQWAVVYGSVCSKTCGGGVQTRTRSVVTQAVYGGQACPALVETFACNTQGCPVDCVVNQWVDVGSCSKTCDGGIQYRSRSVSVQPSNGGASCPILSQTIVCSTQSCPSKVDCQVGQWTSVFGTSCSKTCGSGLQSRTRTVTVSPAYGGSSCPGLYDTIQCNTQACPIDCVVSEWTLFDSFETYHAELHKYVHPDVPCSDVPYTGLCTKTCGGGYRTAYRIIQVAPANGGKACPDLEKQVSCNTQACPSAVDCQVSQWTNVYGTTCSKTCGSGIQSRTRTVTTQASFGGAACPSLSDTVSCNTQECPADCVVSQWVNVFGTTCSKTCGSGVQSRTRTVTVQASYGGVACPSLYDTVACNTQACPIDCIVSEWSMAYGSVCSKTCGGGVQTRTRTVLVYDVLGGKVCPHLTETVSCNTDACPSAIDCQVSQWINVYGSSCSKTCGTGVQSRTRTVIAQPSYGGTACPSLSDTISCNTQACPSAIDCQVSQWLDVSACSKSCGGGVKTRSRSITQLASYGGAACPALYDTVSCNTQECPSSNVDCAVTGWAVYDTFTEYYAAAVALSNTPITTADRFRGACSASCDGGVRYRYRFILRQPSQLGAPCPVLYEAVNCNDQPCPANCVVSEWTLFNTFEDYHAQLHKYVHPEIPCDQIEFTGACTVSCGGGLRTAYRIILGAPAYGGAACPPLEKRVECNLQTCPIKYTTGVQTTAAITTGTASSPTTTQSPNQYTTKQVTTTEQQAQYSQEDPASSSTPVVLIALVGALCGICMVVLIAVLVARRKAASTASKQITNPDTAGTPQFANPIYQGTRTLRSATEMFDVALTDSDDDDFSANRHYLNDHE